MEETLCEKIKETYPPGGDLSLQDIKMLALNLSRHKDFKACKGWVSNFIER